MQKFGFESNLVEETSPSKKSKKAGTSGKKKGRKGKKSSKSGASREQLPDPYAHSSDDLCTLHGLTNVEFDPTDDDFEQITSLKAFNARFRIQLQEANPKANWARLQNVMTAKYNEYQAGIFFNSHIFKKKLKV